MTEDGATIEKEVIDGFKKFAHENNYTKDQAVNLFNWYKDSIVEQSKADIAIVDAAQKEAEDALKADWLNNYETNLDLAAATQAEFFSPETIKLMEDYRIGDNPAFLRDMIKLKAKMSEPNLENTIKEQNANETMTIKEEIKVLQRSPDYWQSEVKQARIRELTEKLVSVGKT